MGCDIHLCLEGKRRDNEKWEQAFFDVILNRSHYPAGQISRGSLIDELISDRCYSLFWLLCGVRYWNREDIQVADPTPLFPLRGKPENSPLLHTEEEDFWIGDHSFTYIDQGEWLSLGEESKRLLIAVAPWFYYTLTQFFGSFGLERLEPHDHPGYLQYRLVVGFDS